MTAPSPLRVMIINTIIHILARLSKTRAPAKRKMLVAALMFFTALHGGTRSEKRAFLKRLIDRNEEIQDRLAARYRIWRQRKCWMWGGGFHACALTGMPGIFPNIRGAQSYDALIPD